MVGYLGYDNFSLDGKPFAALALALALRVVSLSHFDVEQKKSRTGVLFCPQGNSFEIPVL